VNVQSLQRIGGAAALAQAATFMVAFAVFLGVLMPAGYFDEGITPAEQTRIIVENHVVASIGWLIPYVGFGLLQVVLALALYDRLRSGAPAIAQVATAFGLIWAGLVMAGGFVATLGIRTVHDLYGTDPAQAEALWRAAETVATAVSGGAGEVLGGIWLLLIAWAALRARGLPRPLSYLGLILGIAGVITVVPPLEPAVFLFGVGLMVWWVWLGTVMLRTGDRGEAEPVVSRPAAAGR
jgi:hypothetical protein